MTEEEIKYFDERFKEILSLLKPMPDAIRTEDKLSLRDVAREAVDKANAMPVENSQLAKTVLWDYLKTKIGQIPSEELAAHTEDDLLVFNRDKKALNLTLFVLF